MKKILSVAITMALLISYSQQAKAQFGIGAQIATQKFYGDASGYGTALGFGAKVFYVKGEKNRIDGGLIYFPGSKEVIDPYTYQTSTFTINANYNRAFIGSYDNKGFCMYGILGIGLNFYTAKITTTGTNAPININSSTSNTGTNANLGLGGEYPLSENFRVYADLILALGSGDTQNGFDPGYTSIHLGVRYAFGK